MRTDGHVRAEDRAGWRDLTPLMRPRSIVILKVGRSEVARQTALAHSASVVGSAKVVEAALRQHGIIQVASLNELMKTLVLLR